MTVDLRENEGLIAEINRKHPKFVELAGARLDHLLDMKQRPIDAVPTPFRAWNVRCRDFGGGVGLARGWHVTLAGNPGHGKSLGALNLTGAGIRHGEQVGWCSLEMEWHQLTTRLMAIESGERVQFLEPGAFLDPVIHKRAAYALDRIKEETGGSVWVNAREISELQDVEDSILELHEKHGCRFIIVDYMQLVDVLGVHDRIEAVTMISHAVRRLAKRLKIITVGLSQFNRETAKNYEDSPTPQGLMGGSPLENDSDQIILIDHSTYQRNTFGNSARQTLLLAKNRHGSLHKIECVWDYDTLRIRQADDIPPEDRGEAWEPSHPTPAVPETRTGGER